MDQPTSSKYFAVLLGIDDYTDKPLESCVNDVEQMGDFLRDNLGDLVQIHSLTASLNHRDSTEHSSIKPTVGNVISTFEKVIADAESGNFVYIHFSGHGTSKSKENEGHKSVDSMIDDVGLVLLGDEGQNHEVCLWGKQLAIEMRRMTERGLVVTLVLDCCFSGAMNRSDPSTRYLPYDIKIESGLLYSEKVELVKEIEPREDRDGSMRQNWILNPEHYTILTACGPEEETFGVFFDDKSYGGLSYFLREAIAYLGLTKLQRIIHSRVCAKFKTDSCLRKQNPVLYGNSEQAFFGPKDNYSGASTISIIKEPRGVLNLQAGRVHGIDDGDELVLFPSHLSTHKVISKDSIVTAKVVETKAFSSLLKVTTESSDPPRTGWLAMVATSSRLRKIPICFDLDPPDKERWLTVMDKRSLTVHDATMDSKYVFSLRLNDNCEYEISDELGQRLANLPRFPQDETRIDQLCGVLEHLVRFRLFKDLTNMVPSTDLSQSVEVYLKSNGKQLGPGTLVELKHGGKTEISVVNKGSSLVYIFLFDLNPYWQIKSMGQATYLTCYSQRTLTKQITWKVPAKTSRPGIDSCEDILKVIVSSQPTSFELIELPDIWEQTSTTESFRGKPEDSAVSEAWASMNFVIRTSR